MNNFNLCSKEQLRDYCIQRYNANPTRIQYWQNFITTGINASAGGNIYWQFDKDKVEDGNIMQPTFQDPMFFGSVDLNYGNSSVDSAPQYVLLVNQNLITAIKDGIFSSIPVELDSFSEGLTGSPPLPKVGEWIQRPRYGFQNNIMAQQMNWTYIIIGGAIRVEINMYFEGYRVYFA